MVMHYVVVTRIAVKKEMITVDSNKRIKMLTYILVACACRK